MYRNRIAALIPNNRPVAHVGASGCCPGFVAVPVGLATNSSGDLQRQLYQTAFDLARKQLARRSMILSGNYCLN